MLERAAAVGIDEDAASALGKNVFAYKLQWLPTGGSRDPLGTSGGAFGSVVHRNRPKSATSSNARRI